MRPLILEPPRLATVAGGILTMIGTLTPWATGIDFARNPISFSPIMDADGVLFVMLSIAVAILVLSQSVADSRTRTLQASTIVVGSLAVLNWLAIVRTGMPPYVNGARILWTHEQEPGLFIAGAGVALLAIGGSWIGAHAWRHNGTLDDPLDVVLTHQSLVNGMIQVALTIAGFIVGLYGSLAALGPYAILAMSLVALVAVGRKQDGARASAPCCVDGQRAAFLAQTSPNTGVRGCGQPRSADLRRRTVDGVPSLRRLPFERGRSRRRQTGSA